MNFKRLSMVAVQAIGLGLMPAAALAANPISDTTTFTGTVPGVCTYDSGTNQTVAMDYTAANNGTFIGESLNIGLNCNFPTEVQLGAVVANGSNPVTTTSNLAELIKDGSTVVSSGAEPSVTTPLLNANGITNLKIKLTSTGASKPGAYSYTVVLTSLSQ